MVVAAGPPVTHHPPVRSLHVFRELTRRRGGREEVRERRTRSVGRRAEDGAVRGGGEAESGGEHAPAAQTADGDRAAREPLSPPVRERVEPRDGRRTVRSRSLRRKAMTPFRSESGGKRW